MKNKIVYIMFIIFVCLFVPYAVAQTTAPSPTITKNQQIEDLKERLATKVAQLSQTQKKAIFGTVKEVTVSTATIETPTKDIKIELTDDIEVIQILKGKRTTLDIEDITKNDIVTIFGQYDTTLDILKAKVVFIQDPLPVHVSGRVTEIDKTAFTLTITPAEGPAIIIDIERLTKTIAWDGTSTIKSGFSRILEGDTIHVVGTPVPKKENRVSGDRILDLGDVSGSRPTPTPVPVKEASASTTRRPTSIPTTTLTPSP